MNAFPNITQLVSDTSASKLHPDLNFPGLFNSLTLHYICFSNPLFSKLINFFPFIYILCPSIKKKQTPNPSLQLIHLNNLSLLMFPSIKQSEMDFLYKTGINMLLFPTSSRVRFHLVYDVRLISTFTFFQMLLKFADCKWKSDESGRLSPARGPAWEREQWTSSLPALA